MKKTLLPFLILLGLSVVAAAKSNVAGPFGGEGTFMGFEGRTSIVGSIGYGGGSSGSCAGVISADGCPLPMLGI